MQQKYYPLKKTLLSFLMEIKEGIKVFKKKNYHITLCDENEKHFKISLMDFKTIDKYQSLEKKRGYSFEGICNLFEDALKNKNQATFELKKVNEKIHFFLNVKERYKGEIIEEFVLSFIKQDDEISLILSRLNKLENENVLLKKDIELLKMKYKCSRFGKFSIHRFDTIKLNHNRNIASNKKSNYGALYVDEYFHSTESPIKLILNDITGAWFNLMIGIVSCKKIENLPLDLENKHFGSKNFPCSSGVQFHKEHPHKIHLYESDIQSSTNWNTFPFIDEDILSIAINTKIGKYSIRHREKEVIKLKLPSRAEDEFYVIGIRFANDGKSIYAIEIVY